MPSGAVVAHATHHDHTARDGDDETQDVEQDQELERIVFPWVTSKKTRKMPAAHETITATEVVNCHGVPRFLVKNFVENDVSEAAACTSLPFTLLLVFSYSFMVIGHMDAPTLRAVEDSIKFDIQDNSNFAFDSDYMGHKGMDDVNSYVDFWSWLGRGMIPLAFVNEQAWSEELTELNKTKHVIDPQPWPPKQWGILTTYNRIVGGLRLRQEQAPLGTCKSSTSGIASYFYRRKCLDTAQSYGLEPDLVDARHTSPDMSMTQWLWIYKPVDQVLADAKHLELNNWLNTRTQKVEIGIPIYNAEYGVHSLICVNFYFSRGGHIWKQIIPQSCYANWYTSWYHFVFDAVYILCIAWILLNEVVEVCLVVYRFGILGIWTEYFNFFNLIDWISVITGGVVLWMFVHVNTLTATLNDATKAFGPPGRAWDPSNPESIKAKQYAERLEEAVEFVTLLQRALALYPMIVVFRLFKAFHAQPRLALVTMTMQESLLDLYHFLIVFVCVFMVFVTSGVVLFGREVDELSTMLRGTIYCFRLLFGDIDFDELWVAGHTPASCWLVLFCSVASLLLMNMLLAIVMDSYAHVKEKTGDAETIFTALHKQMKHAIIMMKGGKDKPVALEVVKKALETVGVPQQPRKKKKTKPKRDSTEFIDEELGDPAAEHSATKASILYRQMSWPSESASVFDSSQEVVPQKAGKGSAAAWEDDDDESSGDDRRRASFAKLRLSYSSEFESEAEQIEHELNAEVERRPIFPTDLQDIVRRIKMVKSSKAKKVDKSKKKKKNQETSDSDLEPAGPEMVNQQAFDLLLGAVRRFYGQNVQGADDSQYISLGHQCEERVKQVLRMERDAFGSSKDENSVDMSMRYLQGDVLEFLDDVQRNRKQAVDEVTRLRSEVATINEILKQPDMLERLTSPVDEQEVAEDAEETSNKQAGKKTKSQTWMQTIRHAMSFITGAKAGAKGAHEASKGSSSIPTKKLDNAPEDLEEPGAQEVRDLGEDDHDEEDDYEEQEEEEEESDPRDDDKESIRTDIQQQQESAATAQAQIPSLNIESQSPVTNKTTQGTTAQPIVGAGVGSWDSPRLNSASLSVTSQHKDSITDYDDEGSLEEADWPDDVSLPSGSGPPVRTGSVKSIGSFQGGSSMCSSHSFDDRQEQDSDFDISDPFPEDEGEYGPEDRVPSCLASDDGSIGPWSGYVPRVHGAQVEEGVGLSDNNGESASPAQQGNQPVNNPARRDRIAGLNSEFDFKDFSDAQNQLRRLLSKHRN